VVACTAGAEKPSETSTDDGEWGSDADDDGGPGSDDGSSDGGGVDDGDDDVPSDDGDEEDAVSAAELAELAGQIEDLVAFQTSALCFIGHMTDDQEWFGAPTDHEDYPGLWSEITWGEGGESYDYRNRGYGYMTQGPNSDAMKAYEDCF